MPAGIVAAAENLYYDAHPHARNMVATVDHTEAGRVEHAGVNLHLSATPGDAARPTPAKGEYNGYVFSQVLGLDRADHDRLKTAGVRPSGSAARAGCHHVLSRLTPAGSRAA